MIATNLAVSVVVLTDPKTREWFDIKLDAKKNVLLKQIGP